MERSEAQIKPPKFAVVAKMNSAFLDWVFKAWARKNLPTFTPVITSGYRDPEHNQEVGGAENSAHLHGLAYDFVLDYANGQRVPKAQAKTIFRDYIAPTWPGFALWEETPEGVWHVHVNLTRSVTEYMEIIGVAAVGLVGFKVITDWSNSNG